MKISQLLRTICACVLSFSIHTPSYAAIVTDQISDGSSGGGLDTPVVQTFTPSQNNIAGVDSAFSSLGGGPATGNVTLTLWVDPLRIGVPLIQQTLTGVARNAPIEFRWSPFAIIPNDTYYLEFTDTGTLGMAVLINDPYAGGAVIEGGGNLFNGAADLVFKTYYDDQFAVPVPPALWLFGSGLLGLVGMARRKKTV